MGLYAKQTDAKQDLDGDYLNEIDNYSWLLRAYDFVVFRSGQWCLSAGCAPGRQWTGGCLETSSWPGLSLCPSLALSARPSWPCSPTSFCEALKVLSASLSLCSQGGTRIPRERMRACLNLPFCLSLISSVLSSSR